MDHTPHAKQVESRRLPLAFFARYMIIVLGYGINGAIITGIPFLFYHTPLNCLDAAGNSYTCSKTEACENPYGYVEASEYPQIHSITSYLNFHCDRRVLEATIQTIGQFGRSFGYVVLLFFPVPVHRKETMIYCLLLISGVSLCSLSVFDSIEMFGFLFFISNLMFSFFYALMYSYLSETNPSWFSKMGSAYANTSWPIIMIIMIIFSYFHGAWQNILIHFTGIPLALLGIFGFVLRRHISSNADCVKFVREEIEVDRVQNEGEVKTSSYELLKANYSAMRNDKTLRKNVLIWTFIWTANGMCFFGCYMSLNTLKGDLFFNNMSSTIFELISSLIAVAIVQRFNLKTVIMRSYLIIGICFTSCILKGGNSSTDGLSDFGLLFELLPVIVAKVSYEMMWTVLIMYSQQVIQKQYQQTQFTFSNTVGMAVANLIPFYTYLMEIIGVSPFIGYGFFCLASSYFARGFVELESDQDNRVDTNSFEMMKKKNKKTSQIDHPLLRDVELDLMSKINKLHYELEK